MSSLKIIFLAAWIATGPALAEVPSVPGLSLAEEAFLDLKEKSEKSRVDYTAKVEDFKRFPGHQTFPGQLALSEYLLGYMKEKNELLDEILSLWKEVKERESVYEMQDARGFFIFAADWFVLDYNYANEIAREKALEHQDDPIDSQPGVQNFVFAVPAFSESLKSTQDIFWKGRIHDLVLNGSRLSLVLFKPRMQPHTVDIECHSSELAQKLHDFYFAHPEYDFLISDLNKEDGGSLPFTLKMEQLWAVKVEDDYSIHSLAALLQENANSVSISAEAEEIRNVIAENRPLRKENTQGLNAKLTLRGWSAYGPDGSLLQGQSAVLSVRSSPRIPDPISSDLFKKNYDNYLQSLQFVQRNIDPSSPYYDLVQKLSKTMADRADWISQHIKADSP